jgi:hypothetical protein
MIKDWVHRHVATKFLHAFFGSPLQPVIIVHYLPPPLKKPTNPFPLTGYTFFMHFITSILRATCPTHLKSFNFTYYATVNTHLSYLHHHGYTSSLLSHTFNLYFLQCTMNIFVACMEFNIWHSLNTTQSKTDRHVFRIRTTISCSQHTYPSATVPYLRQHYLL